MGPSFLEAAKRGEMQREIERLKESVDYHRVLLTSMQERLALLERPAFVLSSARDAYLEAINIVTKIRMDAFAPRDEQSKKWVEATLNDIVRALQDRLERCGGK